MIAVLERLIEQNQRQPALIAAALVEALRTVGLGVNPPVVSMVNDLPREDLPVKTALPSKDELVKQWFVEHPEDVSMSGRELENTRRPMGVKVSYVTWNKGKPASTGIDRGGA